MATAWLFPGQGSQAKGMGAELFEQFPSVVSVADEVLGYSIAELCRDDPGGRLRQTEFCQPALYVVNCLDLMRLRESGEPEPGFLCGHSLGEYCALYASGSVDFETGLRLVRRRGEIMGRADGGSMAAILGLDEPGVRNLLAAAGVGDVLDIANLNSASQIVVSGPVEAINRLTKHVRATKIGRCLPLPVSAAFHSRYMASASAQFAVALQEHQLRPPRVPVVANVTAQPYPATGVAAMLAQQICQSVRWWDSMLYLRHAGVDRIVQLGPGRVLRDLWAESAADRRPPLVRPHPTVVPGSGPRGNGAGARLGSEGFRRDYGTRHAYAAGAMYRGIASTDLVVRLGNAGLIGFFGAGGLELWEIEAAISEIRARLQPGASFGMNLLASLDDPEQELRTVELFLRQGVRHVEAAGFTQITPSLLLYRFRGAHLDGGAPVAVHHVLAKVSHPEVASAFMRPPPPALLGALLQSGQLTADEVGAARRLPVSADICVESDSGGHTDGGVALTLLPSIRAVRDEVAREFPFAAGVRVGAAGGLGSPEAVAAAFALGADFVVTGSINQCTPEAGTADVVKDLLATLDVRDTTYAPAGDLFELGARVQVVRKGTLFPARGNKLYELYRRHDSLEQLDPATRTTVERYFRRSLGEVWEDAKGYLEKTHPEEVEGVVASPKRRMARVFKWYFAYSTEAAMRGSLEDKANWQIHSGPAIGALNRHLQGGPLEPWRCRHVEEIAEILMTGAAETLARVGGQVLDRVGS